MLNNDWLLMWLFVLIILVYTLTTGRERLDFIKGVYSRILYALKWNAYLTFFNRDKKSGSTPDHDGRKPRPIVH